MSEEFVSYLRQESVESTNIHKNKEGLIFDKLILVNSKKYINCIISREVAKNAKN